METLASSSFKASLSIDKKFIDNVLATERALIVLESPGGMIDPALAIGRAIRLKGFDTIVRNGTACASACGLVWLAGTSRYIGDTAKVGFHAAHVVEDGRRVEKGEANAVVGAYLAMLGLPTRAIRYVTTASPERLSFNDLAEAKNLGIAVERATTEFSPGALRTTNADPQRDGTPSPAEADPARIRVLQSSRLDGPNSSSLRGAIAAYQRGDYANAQTMFLPLAEAGDVLAQTYIGVMQFKGEGIPQDFYAALQWFRKAAVMGHAPAQDNFAYFHREGLATPENHGEAVNWYRKAAEQNYAPAQSNLGLMYEKGWGVSQDAAEAADWYRRAATQGNRHAQVNLGRLYAAGRGVVKDHGQALDLFRKAAQKGYAPAQLQLGIAYMYGNGVPKEHSAAVDWFRKAAEQGNATGQASLGFMYKNGLGVSQSASEALAWYRKAAEQGNALAQANLGAMYERGEAGLPKNALEAVRLYRSAAEQDNAGGQTNLARMYFHGNGVRKNIDEAIKWWRRSADQGNAAGQNDLGWAHFLGLGVPKDFVQSHKWLNLAVARVQPWQKDVQVRARTNRDHVAAQMTSAQINEAQRLAREWKPRPTDAK